MSLKVNGKAYDWGDVDLKIPGLNIEVQEISYETSWRRSWYMAKDISPEGTGLVIINHPQK